MLKQLLCLVMTMAALCAGAAAQSTVPVTTDPLAALQFLEGSWSATGTGQGATSLGSYNFGRELKGHVLARHSRQASCKGPSDFDCEHGDLLYVFAETPGQPLKAIYFDNEGHVIRYSVSTPDPATVVFLSEAAGGGPQFRLIYTLKAGQMTGSFAMLPPGSREWRAYLTWTGTRMAP